jgi:drug/metabolite transporter (DMT)-like permease
MAEGSVGETEARPVVRWGVGDVAALTVVTSWGINFIIVKQVLTEMSPLAFNGLRFIGASVLLLILLRRLGEDWRIRRADMARVTALGLIGIALYQVCFIIGINLTTAGNSSLAIAMAPTMTVMLGAVLGVEKAKRVTWLGVVLAFGGMILVIGGGGGLHLGLDSLWGDLLCLVSAGSWAIYTVFGQSLFRHYSPLKVTTVTMAAGTPLLLLIALPSMLSQDWGAVTPLGWAGLGFSGLFSIAIGYVLFYTAVKHLGATRTATYQNLPPIIAVALGALILGEQMAPVQLVGAAIVLAGIYLTRRGATN